MPHFGSNDFQRCLDIDVSERKISIVSHCCEKMRLSVMYECYRGHGKWECVDILIHYNEVVDEYGLIIHDGGESFVMINYCPWCGNKLPKSKRDLWFDELERLGFDDPLIQTIPNAFKSFEWYKNVG